MYFLIHHAYLCIFRYSWYSPQDVVDKINEHLKLCTSGGPVMISDPVSEPVKKRPRRAHRQSYALPSFESDDG